MNFRKTLKNKAVALVLMAIGIFSVIPDGDAGVCILLFGLALPLFFAKKNIVDEYGEEK